VEGWIAARANNDFPCRPIFGVGVDLPEVTNKIASGAGRSDHLTDLSEPRSNKRCGVVEHTDHQILFRKEMMVKSACGYTRASRYQTGRSPCISKFMQRAYRRINQGCPHFAGAISLSATPSARYNHHTYYLICK